MRRVQSKVQSGSNDLQSLQPNNKGNLQGQDVELISKTDFEGYKTGVKRALDSAFTDKINSKMKAALYRTVGAVLMVAAVALLLYLRVTIPVTYVWPGVTKLLVVAGVGGLFFMGVYLLGLAKIASRHGSDSFSFSQIVDKQSEGMVTYIGNSANLHRVKHD